MFDLNPIFKKALLKLDMLSEKEQRGLHFINELEKIDSKISFSERIALEVAKSLEADAVYFRKFPDDRPSVPQIYIYDFTVHKKKDIKVLHKEIWSNSLVRLYYVITKSEIKIYNSSKPVNQTFNLGFEVDPFETLKIVSESLDDYKKFSSELFDNGVFWEYYGQDFKVDETSYERFIKELKNARTAFLKIAKFSNITANKLLVLSILIKYLEERKEKDIFGNTTGVFEQGFFNRPELGYSNSFIEVVQKGKILNLFDILSEHFNGRIFTIDNLIRNEINEKKEDLEVLAAFLSGKIKNTQYVLWDLYSFNHLPVELISSVYEEFLENEKGVVYTPPYLVNLLIDECMPFDKPKENFKLLDPACGSGIFLVSAYKRIISWWRIRKFTKTGQWIKPNEDHLNELKELLKNSIFGIEIKSEAVDLTIFSLSLALCDIFSPKVIWNDLKFDDLSENNIKYLPEYGFFEWLKTTEKESYDLVIGNPPFIEYTNKEFDKIVKACELQVDQKIPQNQSALLFLQQSVKLLKPNSEGFLCLILPSGPLLYNNSSGTIAFRKNLFSSFNIPQILDFSLIKPFNKKKSQKDSSVSVVAFFINNSSPSEKGTTHIIIKKLNVTKEKLYFEIDHYDFHHIGFNQLINNKNIWKTNLLGGGKLTLIVERLSKIRTIDKYLKDKRKEGWAFGEGFVKLKSDSEITIEDINSGKYKIAEYITGKPSLPTESLTEEGVIENDIYIETEKYFYRISEKEKNIFKGPHILIKETLGEQKIPISYISNYLTFKRRIVGIHAPEESKNELIQLYNYLNKFNTILRFYAICTSSEALISRATAIYKKDIGNFPYFKSPFEFEFSPTENIIIDDILRYLIKYVNLQNIEELEISASIDDLLIFGELISDQLNSIFAKNNLRYYQSKIYETESSYCLSFCYGEKKCELEFISCGNTEKIINHLAKKEYQSLRINKVITIHQNEYFYLIKPKALRYWLRSIALRDTDDILEDLLKAGYKDVERL
jgi:hypothetical protein